MAVSATLVSVIAILLVVVYFGLQTLFAEIFPWQQLWRRRNNRPTVTTKSYAGRTVLITGANGAFGSRAAKLFAQHGVSTLILVDVRDCSGLKEQIETELSANEAQKPTILVWVQDMMTFAGCHALATRVKEANLPSLDHALMTMGILAFNRRESSEGWETSIQVNYLSNALLGLLLLPHLRSSASNPNPPVMTFITSFGLYPSIPTMSLPSSGTYLKHLSNNKGGGMDQPHQYGRSKALLLYFARELAARVTAAQSSGKLQHRITINSADPGTSWTPLTEANRAQLIPRLITNFAARDPIVGATALVNGVSAPGSAHGKIMLDFDNDT